MVRFHAVHSNPILYMLLHAVHLVRSNPDPNRTLRVSIFFRWRRWNLSETDGMERTIVKERRTICCEMCLLMRHLKWTLPRPRLFFFLGAFSHLLLSLFLSTQPGHPSVPHKGISDVKPVMERRTRDAQENKKQKKHDCPAGDGACEHTHSM